MAFTEEQLAELEAAVVSPEAEVQVRDRRVRYRSIDDLLKAKSAVEGEINQAGAVKPVRQILPYCKSGLE